MLFLRENCKASFMPNKKGFFTIKVTGLRPNVTKQLLQRYYSQFGEISSVEVNSSIKESYAYINFYDKSSAKKAQRLTNSQSVLGLIPSVLLKSDDMTKFNLSGQEVTDKIHQPENHTNSGPHQSPPLSQPLTPTIQVTIYGNGITGEDLEHYFGQYGEMVQTPTIHFCATNFAYINYRTIESAVAACRISRFSLKGVTIMMKSSVQEKEIKSDDPLINLMMATVCFKELEEKVDKAVILKPSKNGGVIISGDSVKVKLAESIINLQMEVVKPQITFQTRQLHCKCIPLLADPPLFQNIASKHAVEFNVLTSDGTSKSMIDFSNAVAALSAKPDPMTLEILGEYLSTSNTYLWYFTDNYGTYVPMSSADSAAVETMYQGGGTGHHSIGTWKYSYNFHTMTQTNLSTSKIRNITRTVSSYKVGSITVSCRGLPDIVPTALDNLLHDLNQRITNLPLEIYKMDKKSLTELASLFCVEVESSSDEKIILKGQKIYLRKILIILQKKQLELQAKHQALNSTTSVVSYPSEWEPQSNDIELKSVSHGSKEWSNVEADMKKSMPGVHLIKVERIQNKRLWEKYDFCKKTQLIKNDGIMNEMRLFHGTRANPPEKIYRSEHGFDFRFGKFGRWGKGAYFAVDASYSANYAYKSITGRQILMAYVLTGHSKKMHPDSTMVAPPIKEGCIDEQRYDSVNGDAVTSYGTFHTYIVYDHDKSYPAYLITF